MSFLQNHVPGKIRKTTLKEKVLDFIEGHVFFYLVLTFVLLSFAFFAIRNFHPFIFRMEGVAATATAEFLMSHLRFFPCPHLDLPTNYFVYPYSFNPVFLDWVLEHEYLCGLCQRLFGYGPWQQFYWLFSLAVTSIGSYHLLNFRKIPRFETVFFSLAFSFANFAALCKFPGHYSLVIVHWPILGILTDFCLLDVYLKKERFPSWLILLRAFLFIAVLGNALGYYAGVSFVSGLLTFGYIVLLEFLHSPRTLLQWFGENIRFFLKTYPNKWNYLFTLLILVYAYFILPVIFQIFLTARQGAAAAWWPFPSWHRIILPCFPGFNPFLIKSGPFATVDTFFAGNAGWTFLLVFLLGVVLAARKNFRQYLPFLLLFLSLLFCYEIPVIKYLPFFKTSRIPERFSAFYIVFMSIPFLAIPKEFRPKKIMFFFICLIVLLACVEIPTFYMSKKLWSRTTFMNERPQPAALFDMIEKVRKLPGEAVFFFPFGVHGGDGNGENTYHYLTAYQMQLAGFMQKKMNGFYGGRLDTFDDELPWFFHARWDLFFKLKNISSADCKKELRTYFKNTDYSAAVIFRNYTSPAHMKIFRELFGAPFCRTKYLNQNLEVFDISRFRNPDSIDLNAAKNIQFGAKKNECGKIDNAQLSIQGPGWRDGDTIVLNKGSMQYGPYTFVMKGKYHVRITGENLDKMHFYCTANNGEKHFSLKNMKSSGTVVEYDVKFRKTFSRVEFVTRNLQSEPGKVFNITLTRQK